MKLLKDQVSGEIKFKLDQLDRHLTIRVQSLMEDLVNNDLKRIESDEVELFDILIRLILKADTEPASLITNLMVPLDNEGANLLDDWTISSTGAFLRDFLIKDYHQCGGSMSGKSAHGYNGQTVGYYEHLKLSRLQSGSPTELKTHDPFRVPSAKLEPAVWGEVKKFVLSDQFANDLLERARLMQETMNQVDEAQKLVQKIKMTAGQIEVLAERISTMPKEMDPKPLFDQLARLQQTKTQLELSVNELSKVKPEKDEPVSFESLAVFRRGLKKLIDKGELDKNVQTAIIKKIVHKITIKPNGFEIHFHVGKSYYSRELGNNPSSRIFSFEKDKKGPSDFEKSAGNGQNFDFLKDRSSSLLTIGERCLAFGFPQKNTRAGDGDQPAESNRSANPQPVGGQA